MKLTQYIGKTGLSFIWLLLMVRAETAVWSAGREKRIVKSAALLGPLGAGFTHWFYPHREEGGGERSHPP